MLKMLLDPMGGIVLTNDGHAILREIEVSHPAAKSMIELSRTQDEEVGDGTTTVIILGMFDSRFSHFLQIVAQQTYGGRKKGGAEDGEKKEWQAEAINELMLTWHSW
jgi:hypothetical protein